MFKNILIATDGSEFARRAIDQGLALAKDLNARVTAVLVTEAWVEVVSGEAVLVSPQEDFERDTNSRAACGLGVVAERAATLGLQCDTIHVRNQHPAEGILAAAKDRGCDLIVMASHGRRGLQRLMFGSQTHRVLTKTTLPVLVCR